MSSFVKYKFFSKNALNRTLCFSGIVAYFITMLWCVFGVWFYTVQSLILMFQIVEHKAAPQILGSYNSKIAWFGLAVYFLFYSKSISNFFHHLPVIKPMIVFGLVFFAGISATNNILCLMVNESFEDQNVLYIVAFSGFIGTRIMMSFLFNRYPAEWFAAR